MPTISAVRIVLIGNTTVAANAVEIVAHGSIISHPAGYASGE